MQNKRLLPVLIIHLLLMSGKVLLAQKKSLYFGAEKIVVILNPLTDIPERELPFDRNFFIRKFLPKADSISVISATLMEVKDDSAYDVDARNIIQWENYKKIPVKTGINLTVRPTVDKVESDKLNAFDLFVTKPLKPNRQYDIDVVLTPDYHQCVALIEAFYEMHYRQQGNFQGKVIKIIKAINERKNQKNDATPIEEHEFKLYYQQHLKPLFTAVAVADTVTAVGDTATLRKRLVKSLQNPKLIIDIIPLPQNPVLLPRQPFEQTFVLYNSSTVGFKLDTRAKSRLQPDFGAVIYGWGGNGTINVNKDFFGVVPYVGVNYLFRPFDVDVRLRQLPKGHINWYHRLSLHGGVTLTSLAKDKYRANLLNSFNLLLGGGFRLTSSLKVVSGVIFYRRLKDNPLYTDTSVRAIGYLGLSVDLRVREALGDIGKLLFASK